MAGDFGEKGMFADGNQRLQLLHSDCSSPLPPPTVKSIPSSMVSERERAASDSVPDVGQPNSTLDTWTAQRTPQSSIRQGGRRRRQRWRHAQRLDGQVRTPLEDSSPSGNVASTWESLGLLENGSAHVEGILTVAKGSDGWGNNTCRRSGSGMGFFGNRKSFGRLRRRFGKMEPRLV